MTYTSRGLNMKLTDILEDVIDFTAHKERKAGRRGARGRYDPKSKTGQQLPDIREILEPIEDAVGEVVEELMDHNITLKNAHGVVAKRLAELAAESAHIKEYSS